MAEGRPAVPASCGIRRGSAAEPPLRAKVAAQHLAELRVALGGEHRQLVADRPDQDAGDPEPQPHAQRRRQGAVDDSDGPRRAGKQDRLGKRAVQRHLETFDMRAHVTSAPPPKEKKARKKLVAAKAMESPKTICRRRRKPPEVSPQDRKSTRLNSSH